VCLDFDVDERFLRLFRRQQASGFQDLRALDGALTLPIAEPLLNELIAESLPSSAPVRDVYVTPQTPDRFTIRARVGSVSLLPPVKLTAVIDRQPEFPANPVLVLRLETTGLLSLAGPALRLLNALPPGVRVEHDRIYVDIRTLLESRNLGEYLGFIRELRVNAVDGRAIISVRVSVA
jgi:hypothetical protein